MTNEVTTGGTDLYAQLACRIRNALGEFDDRDKDLETLIRDLARVRTRDDGLRADYEALVIRLGEVTTELEAAASVLPGTYYMDPPDGGDVPVVEQLRRMAKDAARYRWLKGTRLQRWCDANTGEEKGCSFDFDGETHDVDACIDAAMRDSAREDSNG